jgi:outer membrane autotransporter protein
MAQLAPVQNSFQAVSGVATTLLGAVEQHQQTTMAYNLQTGEAAGSAGLDRTLWAQVLGGMARRDSNAEAAGYHSTDFGLAAGVDHLFTPDLLGGVALSWLRAWTHGLDSASGQSSTLDSYQITFYGTYRYGRAFLDGRLGAGWNHFDQSRSIDFLGETASADYEGQQYLVDARAGYDIPVGGPGNLTVTPLVGLRWLQASTHSYTESGAGAADLSVASQTEDSLTQELGVKTRWHLATALGTVEPEVTAAWVHDYVRGPIATSGVMGGEAFAVTTPRIAADGARINVAVTLMKSDSLSFRAEYDGELRDGYQGHTGVFKLRWQF